MTGVQTCALPICEAEGFHARVVQHECDHLIGTLYPMRIRDFTRFGRVPRAYLYCSHDVALPTFVQEQMVAASPCQTVLTLATGHSPFFAAPENLADQLDSLA